MFVIRFLPEFLTEYPLDRSELRAAWKEYLEEKQANFRTICNDIEKIPFFVYAQENREQLKRASFVQRRGKSFKQSKNRT
jgi:hypothetical protein